MWGRSDRDERGAYVIRRPRSGRDTDLPSSAVAGFLGSSLPEKSGICGSLKHPASKGRPDGVVSSMRALNQGLSLGSASFRPG